MPNAIDVCFLSFLPLLSSFSNSVFPWLKSVGCWIHVKYRIPTANVTIWFGVFPVVDNSHKTISWFLFVPKKKKKKKTSGPQITLEIYLDLIAGKQYCNCNGIVRNEHNVSQLQYSKWKIITVSKSGVSFWFRNLINTRTNVDEYNTKSLWILRNWEVYDKKTFQNLNNKID